MPGRHLVVNDGKLVIEKWVGTISHAELLSHEKEHFLDTSIADGAKVLIDAREAEFPETTSDRVVEMVALYPESKSRMSACAALFRSDYFERAKLWETQMRQHGVRVVLFNSFNVACTYLGIDPAQTQGLIDSIEL